MGEHFEKMKFKSLVLSLKIWRFPKLSPTEDRNHQTERRGSRKKSFIDETFQMLKQGNKFHKVVQDTKRYTKDYAKHQKSGTPAIRRSDLEELKIKTRATLLSEMPVYDAQVNEQIGGDKAELFASIVRKARVQVDQEKV